MIKKILFSAALATSSFCMQNELVQIVQEYRFNGLESIQKKLDKILTQESYWLEVLQGQDTDFGYYEDLSFLFVSDKSNLSLWLYKLENGRLTQVSQVNSIVGVGAGAKKIEGDKITPLGVYTFVDKFQKLDPYYGPMAFATNYPNLYDKVLKRTGFGIWIHGMPLNNDRKDKNTKGCIAVENDVITEFDKVIDYKKTLLISYEDAMPKVEKADLALILSTLYQWKDAWVRNDINQYLGFYASDFRRHDRAGLKKFSEYKTRVFAKKETKNIDFSQINITPYPNAEGKQLFRVSFMQKYTAYKNKTITYNSRDPKEIYFEIKDGRALILIEK